MDYESFDYAGSADAALDQLDAAYADWTRGASALSAEIALLRDLYVRLGCR